MDQLIGKKWQTVKTFCICILVLVLVASIIFSLPGCAKSEGDTKAFAIEKSKALTSQMQENISLIVISFFQNQLRVLIYNNLVLMRIGQQDRQPSCKSG